MSTELDVARLQALLAGFADRTIKGLDAMIVVLESAGF
jgi:hypothetical protein